MSTSSGIKTMSRREFNCLVVWVGSLYGIRSVAAPLWEGPALPATGDLDESTLRILMAAAEAVTGVQPLRGHYASYYRHQALYRQGYLTLYGQFAEEVCRSAGKYGYRDFGACNLATRFQILESLRTRSETKQRFEKPVFQETLAVYEATDVWLRLGYLSWEGSARGLESYRSSI